MWLHVCLLAGTGLLAALAATGRMPGRDALTRREWIFLLAILTAGNCLGACMTYARNQNRLWKEDMYFEKQAAGRAATKRKCRQK